MEVRQERSGWRDLALNDRHRLWGWDCPATDLDFIEYNHGWPVALVEYKHERAAPTDTDQINIKVLANLANMADLPAFAVRYAGDFSWWKVVPINRLAEQLVPETTVMLETKYVELLYEIRDLRRPLHSATPGATGRQPVANK